MDFFAVQYTLNKYPQQTTIFSVELWWMKDVNREEKGTKRGLEMTSKSLKTCPCNKLSLCKIINSGGNIMFYNIVKSLSRYKYSLYCQRFQTFHISFLFQLCLPQNEDCVVLLAVATAASLISGKSICQVEELRS